MAGIDRETFGVMRDGWAHTLQSLGVLFVTRIGSRIMRRTVGSAVPAILGRSMTEARILRFKAAIIVACELWEPRFAIDVVFRPDEGQGPLNTPDAMRQGTLAFQAIGEYRPRALQGDLTPEPLPRSITIGQTTSGEIALS